MEYSIIILNAGVGSISYAFEKAGFNIIKAFEGDIRALNLYKKNLNHKIYQKYLYDIDLSDLPITDGLIIDINNQGSSIASNRKKSSYHHSNFINNDMNIFNFISQAISKSNPRFIFFKVPNRYLKKQDNKNNEFIYNLENSLGFKYKIYYQNFYTKILTGFPINENSYYLIGIRWDINNNFSLKIAPTDQVYHIDDFIEDNLVDAYYYRNIKLSEIRKSDKKKTFLCWNQNCYVESDIFKWNLIKPSLVKINDKVRKVTNKELARLKGLPDEYILLDSNKTMLTRMLYRTPNAIVISKFATLLKDTLNSSTDYSSLSEPDVYTEKNISFENAHKSETVIDIEPLKNDSEIDYINSKQESPLIIDYEDNNDHKNETNQISKSNIIFDNRSSELEIACDLKNKLLKLEPGFETNRDYEILCTEILEFLFTDYLTAFKQQQVIHSNTARADLICSIKTDTKSDFFNALIKHFESRYIVFEFKNEAKEIGQNEILLTSKYLSNVSLKKVAIIISRKGCNKNGLSMAKDLRRDNGFLILSLSDTDLINLLNCKNDKNTSPSKYLNELLDKFLINL